jgi:peptide deformylase
MIKPLVTMRDVLSRPCEKVKKGENIKQIIQDLKDTLAAHPSGIGLTANQIGYDKAVSYVRILQSVDEKTKKETFKEIILINPEVTYKNKKVRLEGEGCLSFRGIHVTTDRYAVIGVEYTDETGKETTGLFADMEALAVQHEADHTKGILIFNRKHRRTN